VPARDAGDGNGRAVHAELGDAGSAVRHAASVLQRVFTTSGNPEWPGSLDWEAIETVGPLVHAGCRAWHRQEVQGIERVPRGAGLIVGNHNAGITFIEILGMGAAWYAARGRADPIYSMAHDMMLKVPYLGNFLMHCGALRADPEQGLAALRAGAKVLVCPGGNLEAFRPYAMRHRVDLAGRKGFLKLAIRARAPICPVVFVGGHSSFVVLRDGREVVRLLGLKRLLRVDTWPLTLCLPWGVALGPVFHLPLPVKCVTRFLEPVSLAGYRPRDAKDPAALAELYDRVVGHMQAGMDAVVREM